MSSQRAKLKNGFINQRGKRNGNSGILKASK